MDSRSAEPLQSLCSQQNSRHRSSNNNNALKKKKKRRRRRRRTPKAIETKRGESSFAILSPTTSRESWTLHTGPPTPALRPVGAQVPRAPENSTQFIMDDHENSTLFVDFDNFSTPHWEQEPPVSGAEEDTGSATPTHALTRDWFPFNAADFETAYQSAREDRLMSGSRSELRAAIVALEARAAVLTDALSASPSRLLSTLQVQLLHLQEENAALRQRLARRELKRQQSLESSSSSSTDSDSESDSTNSSSDCSESDCDTCAARRSAAVKEEEEKENTCPMLPTQLSCTLLP
ncbi:uncharacterized protein LOC121873706 [Homarus americanus]|uniref:Putative Hexamethylene bis-acetamide-inducible protein-like n=1 Tax=Homarus americanus TaxID=6706 RepID=A0A8J5JR96_HOMAM|nr:uncharacterized protein LOC121873706 [Homarus americanus]KAG7162691.1 putative Hexamethylene bis-acetamide-inducible protein-like [Homarus americanus]